MPDLTNLPPASALYWHPRTANAGIPTPETLFVPYDHRAAINWMLDEQDPSEEPFDHETLTRNVELACQELTYPCFIRTDHASAKHDGPRSYKVNHPKEIPRVVGRTIEDSELKLDFTPWDPKAIMIREWLTLDHKFEAFALHGKGPGTPIAPEWRLFATKDRVPCAHFYWPQDTMKFCRGQEPDNWERDLREMQYDATFQDAHRMHEQAKQAAAACPAHNVWSVDFAKTTDRGYVLIDMAPAQVSWHPDTCPNTASYRQDQVTQDVRSLVTGEVLLRGDPT